MNITANDVGRKIRDNSGNIHIILSYIAGAQVIITTSGSYKLDGTQAAPSKNATSNLDLVEFIA